MRITQVAWILGTPLTIANMIAELTALWLLCCSITVKTSTSCQRETLRSGLSLVTFVNTTEGQLPCEGVPNIVFMPTNGPLHGGTPAPIPGPRRTSMWGGKDLCSVNSSLFHIHTEGPHHIFISTLGYPPVKTLEWITLRECDHAGGMIKGPHKLRASYSSSFLGFQPYGESLWARPSPMEPKDYFGLTTLAGWAPWA